MRLMRLVRTSALVMVALTAFPGIADAANFAGTWTFSAVMATAQSSPVCVLRQSGNAVAGTCKGPNGMGAASGIVNGNAILLRWSAIRTNAIGMSGLITYHGTWGSDGVIRGTWTASPIPGEVGTFSAQKLR